MGQVVVFCAEGTLFEYDESDRESPVTVYEDVPYLASVESSRMYAASNIQHETFFKIMTDYGLEKYFLNTRGFLMNSGKDSYLEFLSSPKNKMVGEIDRLFYVSSFLPDMSLAKKLHVVGIGVIRNEITTTQEMKNAGAAQVIRSLSDLNYAMTLAE